MKTTTKVLALVAVLTAASQGATTISGNIGPAYKDQAGANIVTGSFGLLIVDTGANGFLDLASGGAISASLSGQTGKTLSVTNAGTLAVGTTFGGDTIISTFTSGSGAAISNILTGVNIASYTGKNFAVVWFTQSQALVTASLSGQKFGVVSLADWTLPAADAGLTFTTSATDAGGTGTFYSASASATGAQVGAGFFTGSGTAADTGSTAVRSAQFTIAAAVPEPSAALLGALGALGLLRRRRI